MLGRADLGQDWSQWNILLVNLRYTIHSLMKRAYRLDPLVIVPRQFTTFMQLEKLLTDFTRLA